MLNDEHHPWGGQISQICPVWQQQAEESLILTHSAEVCELRICAAINKTQWDKIDAQCTQMSTECEEVLQVRQGAPTCEHHTTGLATAIQPAPGNALGEKKLALPGSSSINDESTVSHWEKSVLLICHSHTWWEGASHRLALTLQIPTQPCVPTSWQHFRAGFSQRLTVPEQFLQHIRYKYSFLPISHAGLSCTNTVDNKRKVLPSSYAKCLQCPFGQFHGCWWRAGLRSSGHRVLQHFALAHLLSGRKHVLEILSFS